MRIHMLDLFHENDRKLDIYPDLEYCNFKCILF